MLLAVNGPNVSAVPETKKRPGPVPKLSREAVLDAARELAPDEVTLAAIGARLGVTSPALYRYFEDRTAILEALADEAREQLTPPSEDLPWDEWLRAAASKERALWSAHPDLYESARYRAVAAPFTKMAIVGARVLLSAGFNRADILAILTISSEIAHAIGHAEHNHRTGDRAPSNPEDVAALREILGEGPVDYDAVFNDSLDIAIEGLRARLPKRARRR